MEGSSAEEAEKLRELEREFPELKDDKSFEAAAISMTNLATHEPLPARLRSRVEADAREFFAANKTFAFERKRSRRQWLGWAFAAAAVAILAFNLWTTRLDSKVVYVQITPTPTPSSGQRFAELLASADALKVSMKSVKDSRTLVGEVVWSDSAQKGFLRLRGLAPNNKRKEQYQLWIVAANQNAKTPVDGGVFDIGDAGEIIIPIDAKIKVEKPAVFAITAEKPGGVVVSKQEKVMALGKIGT
jgi:anti-sigma-K factor RskA